MPTADEEEDEDGELSTSRAAMSGRALAKRSTMPLLVRGAVKTFAPTTVTRRMESTSAMSVSELTSHTCMPSR